jgi:hypothetical protein
MNRIFLRIFYLVGCHLFINTFRLFQYSSDLIVSEYIRMCIHYCMYVQVLYCRLILLHPRSYLLLWHRVSTKFFYRIGFRNITPFALDRYHIIELFIAKRCAKNLLS